MHSVPRIVVCSLEICGFERAPADDDQSSRILGKKGNKKFSRKDGMEYKCLRNDVVGMALYC